MMFGEYAPSTKPLRNARRWAIGSWLAGLILLTLLSPTPTAASTPYSDTVTLVVIDFDDFTGDGFEPNPAVGQLDSDLWRVTGMSEGDLPFGSSASTGDFAMGRSPGDVAPSGIYAFEVIPGIITLGIQPSNADFTPGELVLRIENATRDRIIDLQVNYDLWVNNDQPYATQWSVYHSYDDQTYTYSGGDYLSGEAKDALGWQRHSFQVDLNGLSIDHGEPYFLMWASDDAYGHGQRDEFGLNNITISATLTPVNYPPEAADDSDMTAEGGAVTTDVLANDSDPDGDSLGLDNFTQASHGSVLRDDNGTPGDNTDDQLTYLPALGWSGVDSYTYSVTDGFGGQDTATVTVTVEPLPYKIYLPLIDR